MKDVVKGVSIKILSVVLAVALLCGGGYLLYDHFKEKKPDVIEDKTVSSVEIVEERLEAAAELNTAHYICTAITTRTDSKMIEGWKIPFTENSFIISYDGTVKAGIKELAKADVKQDGDKIIVTLPAVEITTVEIDNDSFKVLDEKNNIFNQINLEDVNTAQKELKEKVKEQAIESGVLDMAKSNAETIIGEMLASPTGEYEVVIQWQE